jgi:hypothetical protein
MSLPETIEAIRKSLARAKSAAFALSQSRRAAIAAHDSPRALADALSQLSAAKRERIIAALVDENTASPAPVWQSLLVVAFEPMLLKLRAKIGTPRDNKTIADELDQRVLAAFLDTLRATRPGRFTAMAIAWGTEPRVFAAHDGTREKVDYDEDVEADPHPIATADVKIELDELLDRIEARHGDEVVRAIVATEIGGESLLEYVTRVHADLAPAHRARSYDRLARARNDALDHVRPRLASAA